MPDVTYIKVEPIVKGEKAMKKSLFGVITSGMNGLSRFVKHHPVLSYIGLVGPGILLMACGFVAIQDGFYSTEENEKEGK